MRNREDLLALAARYAAEQRAPAATITKEILHYEILFALQESGAMETLTFQGGTSLRLCYQGNRYSEDLDFAGGKHFDPASMEPFCDVLKREIAGAYGLTVNIKQPKSGDLDAESGVMVSRWSANILVPNPDRSTPQKQLIKIEVAAIPAYDSDLQSVRLNYPHLPVQLSQMLVPVESQVEILADKIVALGARPYFKARDVWDIKFLLDGGIDQHKALPLTARKLVDYGWAVDKFKTALATRIDQLAKPETAAKFHEEMSRFVDTTVARYLARPEFVAKFLERSADLGRQVLETDLQSPVP
jgi:predicted nucleotidyltransferase component of viral defense system